MFSVVSVRHSVHGGRSHLTITHDVLGLNTRGGPPVPRTCSNFFFMFITFYWNVILFVFWISQENWVNVTFYCNQRKSPIWLSANRNLVIEQQIETCCWPISYGFLRRIFLLLLPLCFHFFLSTKQDEVTTEAAPHARRIIHHPGLSHVVSII